MQQTFCIASSVELAVLIGIHGCCSTNSQSALMKCRRKAKLSAHFPVGKGSRGEMARHLRGWIIFPQRTSRVVFGTVRGLK